MKNPSLKTILCLSVLVAILPAAFASKPVKPQYQDDNAFTSPRKFELDSRVRAFSYSPDVVFNLPVSVGMHTHIVLAADEELIESPNLGETVQWRVAGNSKNLYVKALKAGVSTSMTLVSDKRIYQFELRATASPAERIQKVYFDYPEMHGRAVQVSLNVETRKEERRATVARQERQREDEARDKNFRRASGYKVESSGDLATLEVYDDGTKTYMRMPAGLQDLPAIFMVEDGKLTPVNYIVQNRTERGARDELVIERRASQWMLKLGKSESKVSKN